MNYSCTNCGSLNHRADVCNKPKGEWTPPPAPEAPLEPEKRVAAVLDAATAVLEPVLEAKPRWPGAPPVCSAENRMCFDGEAAIAGYFKKSCPSARTDRVWRCKACGFTHYECHTAPPSQDGVRTKLPPNFRPRHRDYPAASPRAFEALLPSAFADHKTAQATAQDEAVESKAPVALPRRPLEAKQSTMF